VQSEIEIRGRLGVCLKTKNQWCVTGVGGSKGGGQAEENRNLNNDWRGGGGEITFKSPDKKRGGGKNWGRGGRQKAERGGGAGKKGGMVKNKQGKDTKTVKKEVERGGGIHVGLWIRGGGWGEKIW